MSKKTLDWNVVFARGGATVKKLAKEAGGLKELATRLSLEFNMGVTPSALESAYRRRNMHPRLKDMFKNPTPDQAADAALEKFRREQSDSSARRANRALVGKVHELERQLQVVLDTKAGTTDLPSISLATKKRAAGKKMEATAVVLASDWHIEERVDPATVNGTNEYNLEISRKRAEKFFRATLFLLEHNRASFEIDNLVLWLGGDLISGYIHEELEESNFLSPPEAILYAMDLLVAGIDLLLKEGKLERIVVPCNRGNHGRIHKKKRVSTASANSFEWMLYKLLAQRYKDEPRIEFMVADGDHLYLDVYDYTIRFMHGDTFNYGGGVGGMVIPIRRGLQRLQQYRKADITCLGHFHTYGDYGDIVTNGCLIGYSPYALSIAASYEPPQQAFFLIEPRHGKCQNTPIWLE